MKRHQRVVSILVIFAAIHDFSKLVVKKQTSWVICSNGDQIFNKEVKDKSTVKCHQ